MDIIYNFIRIVLIGGLVVGLIKPELVLRNFKNPTRIKVIGIFIVSFLLLVGITNLFMGAEEKAKYNIESARTLIEQKDYKGAVDKLKDINEDNPLYEDAQALLSEVKIQINIADSLNRITPEERRAASKLEEEVKLKENLILNLDIIDKFDFSKLRGSVHLLEGELSQFAIWGNLVAKGEASEDDEINKLSNQLKSKLTRVQIREFPILRKEYASIAAKKMWEEDIEVTSSGTGNRYITFIGGVFAANKNKKKFQEDINSIMLEFRFNRVQYKWHKGQQEYTYYTVYEGKDSDIFKFEK